VSDLTVVPSFAQPARRNLALPITLAVLILALVGAVLYFSSAHKTADVSITRTTPYLAHTTFSKQSMVNGTNVIGQASSTEDDLYVVANLRIRNRMLIPLFLDSFSVSLHTTGGQIDTTPLQQQDLETVYASFPALKTLAGPALLRDSTIQPGQTAEGSVVLQFAIPKTAWDQRTDATLTLTFYHQPPITIPIPKP
jgi:hypothetical protein